MQPKNVRRQKEETLKNIIIKIMTAIIIILAFMLISLLLHAYMHGKPKEGKHNFWIHLVSVILTLILYYFAGLFDKFIK